MFVLVNYT